MIGPRKNKLFPFDKGRFYEIWKIASEASGVKLTPQIARKWFITEMIRLGVLDEAVRRFIGHSRKVSVLESNYLALTDEKFKEIYDGADLKIGVKT